MTTAQLPPPSQDLSSPVNQCRDIIRNIDGLVLELDQLKAALDKKSTAVVQRSQTWSQAVPGLGVFERLLLSEKRHLEKVVNEYLELSTPNSTASSTPPTDDTNDCQKYDHDEGGDARDAVERQIQIRLDASNYKYYELVWEITKRCFDLTAMRRDIPRRFDSSAALTGKPLKGVSAVVDIVASGGADWIKVITTTERRLLYEMADAGWDWEDDPTDPDTDKTVAELICDDQTQESIEVVRVARTIVAAARASYQEYRRPRVRILMSRINQGQSPAVDQLLRVLRKVGGGDDVDLTIETAIDGELLTSPTPPLDVALVNLVQMDYFRDFTPELNVDCSVFMALASDFSHSHIGPDSPLLRSKQHHIDALDEVENGPRLIKTLYPAIVGRRLVCTREAADTFLKIASDIGTATEQARTHIIFGDQYQDQQKTVEVESPEQDRAQRVQELQQLSVYPVPEDLYLPIKIDASITWDDAQNMVEGGELPQIALVIGKKGSGLNAMNVSSFLFGWKTGLTTITSNWEAAKRLRTIIEQNRISGDEIGPHIWRIPFSRKLLARPKPVDIAHQTKTNQDRKREKEISLQQSNIPHKFQE